MLRNAPLVPDHNRNAEAVAAAQRIAAAAAAAAVAQEIAAAAAAAAAAAQKTADDAAAAKVNGSCRRSPHLHPVIFCELYCTILQFKYSFDVCSSEVMSRHEHCLNLFLH